jgi:group I intron endonuclease
MIGIYKITSPSGKIYIGQSWNIQNRFSQYKLLQCKGQPKLYNSLLKYGSEAHKFEIEQECSENVCQSILDEREQFFIDFYRQKGELLNIKEGGSHGRHSEESKLKMSEKRKGENYQLGRKRTEESKLKMSLAKKGKPLSEEHKQKLKGIQKGKIVSLKTRIKLSNFYKGRTFSEETINKMKESAKNKKVTEQHKLNISKGMTGRKRGPYKKKILI